MKKDSNKTDRVVLLIQTICRSPRLSLSEKKVKDILGEPSRAQWYKLKQELLEDSGQRKAVLLEMKDDEGNISYQLNQCDWYNYLEGTQEIQFILNFYRELGHLFPKIDTDGITASSKHLDRKFHYLCKIKVKDPASENDNHLETIIRALVGNRKLLIDYKGNSDLKGKTIDIYPLTITQYRDDLYLMAYKQEIKQENIRAYKISRIEKVQDLKDTFKYPLEKNWNPKEYFKNTSGIISGVEKKAKFRVYGDSKKILSEKRIFNAEITEQTKDYDEYTCQFTNIDEFIGLLFIYGQDIEIISDKDLKKAFKEKAELILKRNS
ncbi:WYL domain-containing protein [Bacteriovorax sp. PP10]|uniref:WYL domain-containing protein n=1 Tax=Bacteriovorax antarcticus TaxID=3088717 RepID=A0ABU5W0A4_9BACT|nr:WYL domain-containing protein [Bacteriovorax sp. PP10]MEA9357255.1 WYL domain-containing protein [Bacteriovorax sp. PP10]